MWELSLCSEPGLSTGVKGKTNNKSILGRENSHSEGGQGLGQGSEGLGQGQRGWGSPALGMQQQLCLALLSAQDSAPGHSQLSCSVGIGVTGAIHSVGVPGVLSNLLQLQCCSTQQSWENKLFRTLQFKITSVSLGMPEPAMGFLGEGDE